MRVLALLLSLSLGGCSERPATPAPARRGVARPTRAAQDVPGPDYLGPDGKLRASDVHYVGFAIPVGFRQTGCHGTSCMFESTEVPLRYLHPYVAERVETGSVEVHGQRGATFERATVKGSTFVGHVVQIVITGSARGSSIRIVDIPPFDAGGVDPAERLQQLREAFAREP